MKSLIKQTSLLAFFLLFSTIVFGKSYTLGDLPKLLKGVKYASVNILSAEDKNSPLLQEIRFVCKQYFQSVGFEEVAVTLREKEQLHKKLDTYCDLVDIDFEFQYAYDLLDQMRLHFHFCDGTCIQQSFTKSIKIDYTLPQTLLDIWSQTSVYRLKYDSNLRLSVRHNPIKYSENTLHWIMKDYKMEPIEGIYQVENAPNDIHQSLRVAIFRNKTRGYDIIYLGGAQNRKDWREGEIMGYIKDPLKSNGIFSFSNVNWYFLNKRASFKAHIIFQGRFKRQFTLSFSDSDLIVPFNKKTIMPNQGNDIEKVEKKPRHQQESVEREIKDSTTDFTENNNQVGMVDRNVCPEESITSYGSGIAIDKIGYILTNYHVVKGHSCIRVDTHNGKSYKAIVVKENSEDDIAILKIVDPNFQELPPLPYSFGEEQAEIGEHIFSLGYPQYNTTSEEIKLRIGDVTSKNGYNGDPKTYETSLSLQPGSSGGPAFNTSGKLVGLVKSKYKKSDNVGFIIKPSVLRKTIEDMDYTIQLPSFPTCENLSITDWVKALTPFVFHIKVSE